METFDNELDCIFDTKSYDRESFDQNVYRLMGQEVAKAFSCGLAVKNGKS